MGSKLSWSFGIVTDGKNVEQLKNLISSIKKQNIPEYEILVIGGPEPGWTIDDFKGRFITFDEAQKPAGWITRKKNILAQEAKYENVVLMHDYYLLHDHWASGWDRYDEPWEIATNEIRTKEGTRHSDWTIDPWNMGAFLNFWPFAMNDCRREFPEDNPQYVIGIPYNVTGLEKIQYISGGYMVGKKETFLKYPQKEELLWGQSEDVIWSKEVREHVTFKFNPYPVVSVQKPGKWNTKRTPDTVLESVATFFGCKIERK